MITWFDNFNGNMAAAGNVFFWDDEKEAKSVELWQQNDCLYCEDFLNVFGRHSYKSIKCLGVLLFNFA